MKDSVFQRSVVDIISQLTAAITNFRLYLHVHSLVSEHLGKAYTELSHLLRIKNTVTIFLLGEELILNNRSLFAAGQSVEKFVKIIREKGVERITFLRGMTRLEFEGLIQDLGSKEKESVRAWPNIKLGRVEVRVAVESDEFGNQAVSEEAKEMLDTLAGLDAVEIDRVRELYLLIEGRKQISIRGVDDAVRRVIFEIRRNLNPLSLLATVKGTDEYTFTHVVNVCILTLVQAERLGFSGGQLYDIGMASLLHDVGKTFIPDEILSKPGALTSDERAIIEMHPVKGGRYLMEVGGIPKIAVLAALEHHLRFDGSGYPRVHPGWKPNIVAQMITIADVFDALRSRRSYSAPKSMEEIIRILNKEKGTTFNPLLVKNFLEIIAPESMRADANEESAVRGPVLDTTCVSTPPHQGENRLGSILRHSPKDYQNSA